MEATETAAPETVAAATPAETPDQPGPDQPGRRLRPDWRRLVRRAAAPLLVLVVCLGLAFWLYATAWSSPTTRTVRGGSGDPAIFIYFLRWVPLALDRGHDLLVTHHLNYPDGVNLMWNTSLVLPGLVLGPLTVKLGPVLSFNVLLVLGIGLSSWCAYLAIRCFVPGHLAAAIGGLVYGFSPAILGQAGHPHMSLAFLAPLMLLVLHHILVDQRRSPWLSGAALGLMAGCQLLIGEELLALTALLGLVMFVALVLGNLRRLRGRFLHAVKAFLTAAVVFAAIAVWPLSVQLNGPQHVEGDIHERNRANDLQGYVLPSIQQAIALRPAAERVKDFGGGNSAYLGIPLLLVLAAIGVRWWSKAVVRVALVLLVVSAVLSLGPTLMVGTRDTGIWLPWAAVERLPLLSSLIPNRFSQLTALFAGLLLALFLHAVWGQGGRRRWAAAAVGLVVLAPLWPAGDVPTEPVVTPAFFTGPAVRQLPRDSVALVLPFPNSTVALPMTWQAQADLWFRMPGGYFIGPTPEGKPRFGVNPSHGSRVLNRIYRGLPPPRLSQAWRRLMADDFVRWRVGSVIVGPMPNQAVIVQFLTELLGRPPQLIDGVYLWRDPVVVLEPPAPEGRRR